MFAQQQAAATPTRKFGDITNVGKDGVTNKAPAAKKNVNASTPVQGTKSKLSIQTPKLSGSPGKAMAKLAAQNVRMANQKKSLVTEWQQTGGAIGPNDTTKSIVKPYQSETPSKAAMTGKVSLNKSRLTSLKEQSVPRHASPAPIKDGHVPAVKETLMEAARVSTASPANSSFDGNNLEWDDQYSFKMMNDESMRDDSNDADEETAKADDNDGINMENDATATETVDESAADVSGLDVLASVVISDTRNQTPDVPVMDLIPTTDDRPDVNDLINQSSGNVLGHKYQEELTAKDAEISNMAAEAREKDMHIESEVEARVQQRLEVKVTRFDVPETPLPATPRGVMRPSSMLVESAQKLGSAQETTASKPAQPNLQAAQDHTHMIHALNARLTVTKHYITAMEETLHKSLTGTPSREAIDIALGAMTKIGAYTRDIDMLEQKINQLAQEHYGAAALPQNLFTVGQRSAELARRLNARLHDRKMVEAQIQAKKQKEQMERQQKARMAQQQRRHSMMALQAGGKPIHPQALAAVSDAVNTAMQKKEVALRQKEFQLQRSQAQIQKLHHAYKAQQAVIQDMSFRLDGSMNPAMQTSLNESLQMVAQQNAMILQQLNGTPAVRDKRKSGLIRRTFSSFRKKRSSTYNNPQSTPIADQRPIKRLSGTHTGVDIC